MCVCEKEPDCGQTQFTGNYKCASILGTNAVMWLLKGLLFVSRIPFWAPEKHTMDHNH